MSVSPIDERDLTTVVEVVLKRNEQVKELPGQVSDFERVTGQQRLPIIDLMAKTGAMPPENVWADLKRRVSERC